MRGLAGRNTGVMTDCTVIRIYVEMVIHDAGKGREIRKRVTG